MQNQVCLNMFERINENTTNFANSCMETFSLVKNVRS